MYLREVHIRNSGPIDSLDLPIGVDADGSPLVYAFLGPNGSGKTNLLSLVGDALFEAAATAFHDIVPSSGLTRSWFRMVGATTITHGTRGGFSILKFEHSGNAYFYKEKAGTFSPSAAKELLPEDVANVVKWSEVGNYKEFNLPENVAKEVFTAGAYAYFPSSRAEFPHWLNVSSLKEDRFSTTQSLSTDLNKPLFVEQGMNQFSQWLMGVVSDARVDIVPLMTAIQTSINDDKLDRQGMYEKVASAARELNAYLASNTILQAVLGDESARFVWTGRHFPRKIGIEYSGRFITTDALSAGQASLLVIFGTLLRYGDTNGFQPPSNIEGICIVDEIDAHMHVNLQTEALPKLIALFPKVQFLVSGHSPLFVLGLHRQLGTRVKFIELPTGSSISPETYSEFARALDVFKETEAVAQLIAQEAATLQRPKVYFEGETDPQYFTAAAEVLGFSDLLKAADFEWVGAKDPNSGHPFNTGKDALNKVFALLKAKPDLIQQTVVLVYDCDTNKTGTDDGKLHVRVLPHNPMNMIARRGIENLLPEEAFTDDVYDECTRQKEYGGKITSTDLNKIRLCKKICDCREGSYFEAFKPILEELARLILGAVPGSMSASADVE